MHIQLVIDSYTVATLLLIAILHKVKSSQAVDW